MVSLHFVATLNTGIEAYDHALADLEIVSGPNDTTLAAVARSGGGIVTYTIGSGGAVLADYTNVAATAQAGQRPRLVDLGEDSLLLAGVSGNSVVQLSLDDDGSVLSSRAQGGVSGAVQASEAVLLGADTVVMAGPAQTTTTAYAVSSDDLLHSAVWISDTPDAYGAAVGALGAGTGAASSVLLVGSQSEYGVTSYLFDAGTPSVADGIGPEDGLGIMVPTGIATLSIGGRSFAIVASSAGPVGDAGALSVLEVGADGGLTPRDHLLDTLNARFGAAQCVAAVEIDGRGFVVAGGGDHGLSLFTLAPNGRLIHLQSLADTASIGLSGAIDIEMVVNGDRLEVFVITEADAGIAHFLVDISDLGNTRLARESGQALAGDNRETLLVGGDGPDTLTGSGRDDILFDGAGRDRLTGNGGADLLVFVQDGTRDTITDFNAAVDRIDLSGWAFLYDTTQLVIEEKGGHTRITYRDERLDVFSNAGGPVDPELLRSAVVLDVNRAFLPPSLALYGTASDERLTGSWGPDTLNGRGGDDTIVSRQGDDSINGGGGTDTLVLNIRSDAATIIDVGGGAFEIRSAQGSDHAAAVELFAFRNETLSTQQMQARAVPDPGTLGVVHQGTADHDTLDGGEFNDTLLGLTGDDTLRGRQGQDRLDGGAGDDRLIGGNGDDVLDGGPGDDRLLGKGGDDLLIGGPGGNRINGHSGADSLYGGEARDILNGGGGADIAFGYESNDRIVGGRQNDTLSGGAGPDKLYGNANNDSLDGGTGDDLLNGGGGADTLNGGSGNDYLKGGGGSDVFIYALGDGRDRIVDFDPQDDLILFCEDLETAYASAQALIDDHASITNAGVVFDFDGQDRLIIGNLENLDGLAEAIRFEGA